MSDRRHPKSFALLTLALSSLVSLALLEVGLRLFSSGPLDYTGVIEQRFVAPERLFPADTRTRYDIRGLYAGADEAVLQVGDNRVIEPEPDFDARYRVLFLGGSTTECLYVPESQRWVAQLNEPGFLAAYNGGQSGKNSIDSYHTFLYLTQEKDLRFDLVVLMSAVNDIGWTMRLREHGHDFDHDSYEAGVRAWLESEKQQTSTLQALRQRIRIVDLVLRLRQALRAPNPAATDDEQTTVSPVVRSYLGKQQAARRYSEKPLAECEPFDALLQGYLENERGNIGRLARAAAEAGSALLVLSEPTSYGAPAESFLIDLRAGGRVFDCALSNEDSRHALSEINRHYLQAAEKAGALTFDMAAAFGAHSNGPDGGRYMYDDLHYTAEGATLFADLLRPQLRAILTASAAGPRSVAQTGVQPHAIKSSDE